LQYFRQALGDHDEIHVFDSDRVTLAFDLADNGVICPFAVSAEYPAFLHNYIIQHHIDLVIPLHDMDVNVLSGVKKSFSDLKTVLMIPEPETAYRCSDKLQAYRWIEAHRGQLSQAFYIPKTLLFRSGTAADAGLLTSEMPQVPVFDSGYIVKPRFGMGSVGVFDTDDRDELFWLCRYSAETVRKKRQRRLPVTEYTDGSSVISYHDILIQERIVGQEYGLCIFSDLQARYISTAVIRKDGMRAGETDSGEVIRSPQLESLGAYLAGIFPSPGCLEADIIVRNDGMPCILEVNPRIGGLYPFAHMAGCNLPAAIVRWLEQASDPAAVDLLQVKNEIRGEKDIYPVKVQKQLV